jgi:SAM-dependent methyltransferase
MTESSAMADTAFPVNHTERFTGRVEAYRRFRSRFPREIIALLNDHCELMPACVIADLGAGTGMFSELFLENGNSVFAVEPNAEMRAACNELRSSYPRLTCVDATAEATGLPDRSVDFVTAARAFHWFDQGKCHPELLRILRPNGWVVIASLGPRHGPEPVTREYEALLREYGLDFDGRYSWCHIEDSARRFLSGCDMHKAQFVGVDNLDFEGVLGHSLSISVTPQRGDPRFSTFQQAIRDYFERHQFQGTLALPTNCELYFGQLR